MDQAQLDRLRSKEEKAKINDKDELGSIYYLEKCGFNLDRNRINILKIEEPYNF